MNDFFEDVDIDFRNKSIKDFTVSPCERNHIRDFIEKWHYSKNVNGVISKYNFKLTCDNVLIGGMM